MKRKVVLLVLLIALLIGLTSCATIFKGSSKQIPINSTPSNASIVIKNSNGLQVFNGITPSTVTLKKGQSYNVVISMSGYRTETLLINQQFEPLFLGNLICGGIIGIIIDLLTGAYMDLTPASLYVNLESVGEKKTELDDGIKYAVVRLVDLKGKNHKVIVPLVKA